MGALCISHTNLTQSPLPLSSPLLPSPPIPSPPLPSPPFPSPPLPLPQAKRVQHLCLSTPLWRSRSSPSLGLRLPSLPEHLSRPPPQEGKRMTVAMLSISRSTVDCKCTPEDEDDLHCQNVVLLQSTVLCEMLNITIAM